MLLMLLPLDLLVAVYMHVISAMLLFGANVLSQSCVEEEIELIHNNGMGKGSLYDSHIDFMKTHLYDSIGDDNNVQADRDTYPELLSLPAFCASILQPSPLIKRQVDKDVLIIILKNDKKHFNLCLTFTQNILSNITSCISIIQIVQGMCYISLSMLIAWCLSLEEDKDRKTQSTGKNIISSIIKFFFRWLPMAYVFPLCARVVHSYFHEYLITVYLEQNQNSNMKASFGDQVTNTFAFLTLL